MTENLECLGTASPLRRKDTTEHRALFPPEAFEHPARMRLHVAMELIRDWIPWRNPPDHVSHGGIILDPLMGIGTTAVASALEGCDSFFGAELKASYVGLVSQAIANAQHYACHKLREVALRAGRAQDIKPFIKHRSYLADAILTSPPFPNHKKQGESATQDHLRKTKGTVAGTYIEGCDDWRTEAGFKRNLSEVLGAWIPFLLPWGRVLVHVKNFVRGNKVVHVDDWATTAMEGVGLEVLGYVSIPIDWNSWGKEFGGASPKPRRKVIRRTYHQEGRFCGAGIRGGQVWRERRIRTDHLECGHLKERKPDTKEVKSAQCIECDPLDRTQVMEERVIIAKRAA